MLSLAHIVCTLAFLVLVFFSFNKVFIYIYITFVLSLFPLADMRKPKLAAEIARQLRKFHEVEIPGSKEPQLWNDISKFFEKGSFISP